MCSGDFLGFMLAYVGFMLAYAGLMLAYAGFMLAYVGSSWLMSAQVGPSWPQDASMLAQNPRKSPEHTSQGLQEANFLRFLIENCSFWSTLDLENIEKSICFIGPFAICTFFLLLMFVWVSKLAQVRSKLAHVGLLEQIGVQVEPSWHQLGSRCVNFVPSWPPKKSVSQ